MGNMRRAGAGLILICALAALALWLRPDPPPPAGAPPPPPRGLEARDASPLLERFLARHAKSPGEGVREARLLVRALPEATRPLLDRIASDPSRPAEDRRFAIRTLRFAPRAEEALERLALRLDRETSGAAIEALCSLDLRGDHLQVYVAGCAAGLPEAFDAISHWADAGTIAVVRKYPDAGRDAARRHEILLSSAWVQQIEAILREPGHALARWALHVARLRALPGLAGLLRERLDSSGPDPFRDEMRAALFEMGGKMTDAERDFLEKAGYLGDPAARLADVLAGR